MNNYPTIAELNAADSAKLHSWRRTLPAPQTDVERTVWRRIVARTEAKPESLTEKFDAMFKEVFGDVK